MNRMVVKDKLLIPILSIIVFSVLFFIAVKTGLGIDYDSKIYIKGAEYIQSYGIISFLNEPSFAMWPPLEFVVISGIKSYSSLLLFQYLMVVISILYWNNFYSSFYEPDKLNQWVFALLLSTNVGLLLCAKFLWSESLFLFLVSTIIYYVFKYVKTQKVAYLFLIGLLSILLPLQRISGLFIILSIIAVTIFFLNNYRLILFESLGLFSFTGWFLITNAGLSRREGIELSFGLFSDVIFNYFDVVQKNFFPSILPYPVLGVLISCLVLIPLFVKAIGNIYIPTLFIWMTNTALIILSIFLKKAGNDQQEIMRFLTPIIPLLLILVLESISVLGVKWKIDRKLLILIPTLLSIYSFVRAIKNSILFSEL
ncbi:hypothetical protein [Flammeovirga agarivorans]|uniref:Glycosyltransferase RgtA/B/C/D-like domain-containing protein n=1 Tax=Flammeovirga agarivorans TaxID=2726742 RepID=A0A7X8SN02_9BACT|nr:hypothetical protein [Flammeovirga agarivorans]NLR93216.1 hypothetical protein [Flammeovirga agarivorans]